MKFLNQIALNMSFISGENEKDSQKQELIRGSENHYFAGRSIRPAEK